MIWAPFGVTITSSCISLVSNYRTQFNKIIQTNGYDSLVEKMKSTQTQLAGEDAQKRGGP